MADDVVVRIDKEFEAEAVAVFESTAEAVVEGSVGEREKGFFLASCGRHGCGIRVARLFGSIGL
jgi:hypothetical protein